MAGLTRTLIWESPEDAAALGRRLALLMPESGVSSLFLRGPLGSGKTTLANALVKALPGGGMAEAGSPSFSVCHHYPTTPPVLHCDLYRCRTNPPDELLDGLENPALLCIVEWADFLPANCRPPESLDMDMELCDKGRILRLQAHGRCAARLLDALCEKGLSAQA